MSNGASRHQRIEELEVARLRTIGESKIQEARALENQAEQTDDEQLEVAARARRAEAKEYFREAKRKTGSAEFLRGFGFPGRRA